MQISLFGAGSQVAKELIEAIGSKYGAVQLVEKFAVPSTAIKVD
jgi:hypothetical protein